MARSEKQINAKHTSDTISRTYHQSDPKVKAKSFKNGDKISIASVSPGSPLNGATFTVAGSNYDPSAVLAVAGTELTLKDEGNTAAIDTADTSVYPTHPPNSGTATSATPLVVDGSTRIVPTAVAAVITDTFSFQEAAGTLRAGNGIKRDASFQNSLEPVADRGTDQARTFVHFWLYRRIKSPQRTKHHNKQRKNHY